MPAVANLYKAACEQGAGNDRRQTGTVRLRHIDGTALSVQEIADSLQLALTQLARHTFENFGRCIGIAQSAVGAAGAHAQLAGDVAQIVAAKVEEATG